MSCKSFICAFVTCFHTMSLQGEGRIYFNLTLTVTTVVTLNEAIIYLSSIPHNNKQLLYVTSFGVWSPVSSPVVTSSIRVYCSKWSSLYSKSSIYFVLFVVVRVSFVKLAPPFLQCLFTVIHSHYGADCSLSIRPKKHTIL